MSDTRLRDLERRWRATGAVDDEAEFLRERVRAGDLAQQWLDLAALLQHPAAERACTPRSAHGVPPQLRPGPLVDWTALEDTEEIEWFREVERLGGAEALLRVIAAVFNLSPGAHARPQNHHSLLFEQVDRAALSPCEAHFTEMMCHRRSDYPGSLANPRLRHLRSAEPEARIRERSGIEKIRRVPLTQYRLSKNTCNPTLVLACRRTGP